MNRLLPPLFLILTFVFAFAANAYGRPQQAAAPATADSASAADSARVALAPDDPLPLDPNVRIDTLENGLVYYIRRNTEPENRAELRLAIDAGSVLEEDDQLGLAHFLEHMLFNGTRRFEEQELINFLERTGMRFGPDVNAYTSFDETVYMLEIPMDSAEVVQKAFDVLEDWAAYATLSGEEIEKERGVIIEEWRARQQSVQGRITEEVLPALFQGARYADRLPIGDTTVIKNAPPEALRRFYRDWYRPDLMAVVAVGDFEVDRIEELIRAHFAGLELRPEVPERTTFDVPGSEETLYRVITDPELPIASVSVYYKKEAEELSTTTDYREGLTSQLFNGILNERLAEIVRRPGAPFVGARVFKGAFVRPSEFYGLTATVQPDSLLHGLEAALTEAARVQQYGFTETEIEREKTELLRAYEQAYTERRNTPSAAYAREYVANFLEGEAIPGIRFEYELVQRLLPEISAADVNRLAAELLDGENRVVIAQVPEKPDVQAPTEDELAAVIEAVQDKAIEPYLDEVSDAPLLSNAPEPAAIASEREIPEVGVTELTLENGVRVVMKPTDFKEDEVRMTAFSPGGTSLVSDSVYFAADNAARLVALSGVGDFDRTELDKKLAGQVVHVSPYIGEIEEGLSASASPQDLRTLFELVHLYFTAPRADQDALEAYQARFRASIENRALTPESALQDTLTATLYDNDLRRRFPTLEQVDRLDLETAFEVYQDRFADAGDFTFIFVGNFDPDTLRALARTYLGTLPTTDREETFRDVAPDLPEGTIEKTVQKGLGERSQVVMLFHGPFTYTRENRHRLRALADVLRIVLREELREERGGVYNVSVSASATDRPDSTYRFQISFTSDPARVAELTEAVMAQIEQIKEEGPEADDVQKVQEQQRRQRETQLEENAFWLGTLSFYYSHTDERLLDVLDYPELIGSLTAEAVEEAAARYLDEDRFVQAVLYPENVEAAE